LVGILRRHESRATRRRRGNAGGIRRRRAITAKSIRHHSAARRRRTTTKMVVVHINTARNGHASVGRHKAVVPAARVQVRGRGLARALPAAVDAIAVQRVAHQPRVGLAAVVRARQVAVVVVRVRVAGALVAQRGGRVGAAVDGQIGQTCCNV